MRFVARRLLLAVLTCAALPATAAAAGRYEPNDSKQLATGPILAGTPYSAALDDGYVIGSGNQQEGDVDWFVFYVSGPAKVDLTFSDTQVTTDDCFGPEATLLGDDGTSYGAVLTPRDQVDQLVADLPAAGAYYIRMLGHPIQPCPTPDEPYTFVLDVLSQQLQSPGEVTTPLGVMPTPPVVAGSTNAVPAASAGTAPAPGAGAPPRPAPAVKPKVKRTPSLKVSTARLTSKQLTLSGTLAKAATATRVRVSALGTVGGRTVSFALKGTATKVAGRWTARATIPKRLRTTKRLRYVVGYLGDATHKPQSLKARSVIRGAR